MLHLFVYGEKQNLSPLPELLDHLIVRLQVRIFSSFQPSSFSAGSSDSVVATIWCPSPDYGTQWAPFSIVNASLELMERYCQSDT
jgi:hypothetical protein